MQKQQFSQSFIFDYNHFIKQTSPVINYKFVKGFYGGPDDADHLRAAYSQYSDHILKLKNEKFEFLMANGPEMCEMEFFLIGDNNFLAHTYGHQGRLLQIKIIKQK